jgi:hypothetical protein
MSRDEFTAATKARIAARQGYLCAFPGCPTPHTVGAARSGDGVINVGTAAHITAASPKGPRFDSKLTSAQRRHQNNGVWMCNVHGKAVDDDDATFAVEQLRKWKAQAETRSLPNVWTNAVLSGLVAPDEDKPDGPLLASLCLSANTDLEALTATVKSAARADLDSFRRGPSWPEEPVLLDLSYAGEDGPKRFSAEALASAAIAFQAMTVMAPPGVGKTTTLLQAARAVLDQGAFIAVFIPLPEWSAQAQGILAYVAGRQAFSTVSAAQLSLLASFGRLVVLLDGWNELDASSRRRAAAELGALQRQFPELGLILSTRRQAMDTPIEGPIVSVNSLTDTQQLTIARRKAGSAGEGLLDAAWRTPGVADLVAVPLYLNALLASATVDDLPTTKEGILRLFVDQHLQNWRRREALNHAFSGCEGDFLQALAVSATQAANTSIQASVARSVVVDTASRLTQDGQFVLRTQPADLLDVLVSEHSLINAGAGGFAFQHQQFQEWYASLEVERVMVAAAGGDAESRRRLRDDILNWPVWEEAVLFAVERLSRRNEEALSAAAAATGQALAVDPLLAAEMIFRAAPALWEGVRRQVTDLVGRWHLAGRVDRAARFMVTTGKPDFSDAVWAIIETETEQRYVSIFEVARRFRASVLRAEHRGRLKDLPEERRRHVLADLAYNGDLDGIALAAQVAATDPSERVHTAVIQACLHRRAEQAALAVLRDAEESVWESILASGWAEDIADPATRKRLMAIQARRLQADPSGRARLMAIADSPTAPELGPEARSLIEDRAFPLAASENAPLVARLHALYPTDVAGALTNRMIAGEALPLVGREIVRESGLVVEDGPIAEFVLAPGPRFGPATIAAALVGPATVARLLDMHLEAAAAWRAADQPEKTRIYEAAEWIGDRLHATPPNAFVEVLLARTDLGLEGIAEMSELFARHGRRDEPPAQALEAPLAEALVQRLLEWANLFIAQGDVVSRYQRDRLITALSRVNDLRFLPSLVTLLDQEVAQWREARRNRMANPMRRRNSDDGTTNYFLNYRQALIALPGLAVADAMLARLSDPDFGSEAAQVLRAIWDRAAGTQDDPVRRMSSFSFVEVAARRREREEGPPTLPSPYADAILTAAGDIVASDPIPQDHVRALTLAAVGFQLPHDGYDALVDRLLALPGNTRAKMHLLTMRVLAGHRLDAGAVLTGLAEVIAIGQSATWRLSLDNGEVIGWLALLAQSDDPAATLTGLDMIASLNPQPWQLREVLSSLSANPADAAEAVLLGLVQRDRRFLQQWDWRLAVERRRTVGAARAMLEIAKVDPHEFASRTFAQSVALVMADNPPFRAEIYRRYGALPYGPAATTLASVIAEAPDTEGLLLLIHGEAIRGPARSDGMVEHAIRKLAVGHRESQEWGGATETFSEPVQELRRALLDLTITRGPQATVAREALMSIDALRDQYGLVETEPRHPNLASGIAWPAA